MEPQWDEIDGIDWDAAWKPTWITAEQVAAVFDVPPAILGLPWYEDTGVLAPDECPSNSAPYVPGQLGINAMLVQQQNPMTAPGWEGKTSQEVLASVQAAFEAYKGKNSPLIVTPTQAQEKAQQLLKAHGVKIARLDDSDGQTPVWTEVGGIDSMSLSLEYDMSGQEALKKMQPSISQAITSATLNQQVAVEKGGAKFPKFSTTHELDTGAVLIEYPDDISTVHLPGTVHIPASGMHKFDYKGTFPTGLARIMVGLDPVPPGQKLPVVQQWAAGQPFFWHPEHGWMPEEAFDMAPAEAVSTGPDLLEDQPKPEIAPQAHLWCTACDVHWMDHKGDPVACDSGGYLRPSTPLEDKQYVARLVMLKETGLA